MVPSVFASYILCVVVYKPVAFDFFLWHSSSHWRCTVQPETDTGENMKAVSTTLNCIGLALVGAAVLGAFSFGALGFYMLVLLQS